MAARAYRVLAAPLRSGLVIDAAIATLALAGSLAQLSRGGLSDSPHATGDLDWTGGLLAACSTLPLLAWRRAPGVVFVLTASATVLLAGLDYPLTVALGPAVALFLLAESRDAEHPWTKRSSGMVVALFGAYLVAAGFGDDGFPGSELFHTGLAWAAAWFAGERTRLRRREVAELRERALRAEREGERERRLAAVEERARIARDLHDAAGHAISVIAVRAGTARLRRDPGRSQAALEAIEELARKTAAEIDQIVGTLRERGPDNGAVDAPPGLASLDTLVARHAATGLDVRVASEGEPRKLDGEVDRATYRILQEALNNAARHSGAERVEVRLRRASEGGVELEVADDGRGFAFDESERGLGIGGMRERALLVGGELKIESRPGRGTTVHLSVPADSER